MTHTVVAYTDLNEAVQAERKNLSPILDTYLRELGGMPGDSECTTPASRIRLTQDPSEAEYFILPKHWTCYLWNGKRDMSDAMKMAELADRFGKPLIIWFKGDLVPRIPFDNYVLFLPGIVKSTQKANHISCPVFIDDPQPRFGQPDKLFREKNGKPTLGFCGYATTGALKTSWSVVNGVGLKVREKLGKGDYESLPILPSTFLRSRALDAGSKSDSVHTDFIIRRRYTPPVSSVKGRKDADERLAAFFANVYGTDYTICMRGYGNWSYRFYETLACGRIPVFLDTGCVLPLNDVIDWKKYCVWVDRSEVRQLGEKVADFHGSLSPGDFVDLQRACRKLWESRLTLDGFMNDLHLYLPQ